MVRMLVLKNGVKGSIFGLVASSTFLENRVLFRLISTFRVTFQPKYVSFKFLVAHLELFSLGFFLLK